MLKVLKPTLRAFASVPAGLAMADGCPIYGMMALVKATAACAGLDNRSQRFVHDTDSTLLQGSARGFVAAVNNSGIKANSMTKEQTRQVKWMGGKRCDICQTDVTLQHWFADSPIRGRGYWALMCPSCWHQHGMGAFGIGVGQKYDGKTLNKIT